MPISKQKIEKWSGALALLAALVAGFYGVVSFVDSRIDKRLGEDETLKKIAALVRPSCVFDQSGSILYDSGAMQLIESIEPAPLTPQESKEGRILPRRIAVRPRQLLRDSPIITVLSPYVVSVSAERGQKFDWIYTFDYMSMPDTDHTKCRYRLEVLP